MSISIQTLNDTIIALVTVVGVAVALSLAFIAAGAFFERGRKHGHQAGHNGGTQALHPTQTDDHTRELVLR
jgi:hypothetical protein